MRKDGCWNCKSLNVIVAFFEFILWQTGSQCRSEKIGVMRNYYIMHGAIYSTLFRKLSKNRRQVILIPITSRQNSSVKKDATFCFHCCISLPSHIHISTGRQSIIPTLMLQIPKPSQSAMPHHLSHSLITQNTLQNFTMLPVLQRHSTHPPHHHTFCSLSRLCSFPTFIITHVSVPYVTALWTQTLYIFLFIKFHVKNAPWENGR